jgi:serine/threonine protein kinase
MIKAAVASTRICVNHQQHTDISKRRMVPDHEIDIANSITLLFEEEEEDEEESPQHSSSTKIIRMVQEVDPPRSVSRSSTPQKSLNNTVVPQFSLSSDISVGKLLGAGGFCVVRAAQITAIGEEAHQSAIKMPRPCTNDEQQQAKYELTIKDMKNEAGILAGLSHHQNIINLKGVSRADEPVTYFLILGRLDYTLSQQMSQWRETLNWRKSSRGSRRKALQTRLEDVAIGIANGLEYLHKKGIVHRDIKPENIGFNEFDTPVLFDFGLARQCQPDDDAKLFQNMDHAPDFNDSTVSMMSAIDDGSGVFSESTNTDASGLTDSTGLAGTPR